MDYFAGLGISMDETHVCVSPFGGLPREAALRRGRQVERVLERALQAWERRFGYEGPKGCFRDCPRRPSPIKHFGFILPQ
jgi:hypothetical protein